MKIHKAIILAILTQLFLPSTVNADELRPPCRLQISVAHLSTNLFENSQIRAVKVNTSSICNVPQSNVTITVEIWKTGFLGNHLVWGQTTRSLGTTFPGYRVNNFSTYKKCLNRTPTNYYGVSYSKALIDGRWHYARHVLSEKIILLKCGT